MRVFDSGMPDESYWNSLFDIKKIVDWLDVKNVAGPIVEIGCGYGTFTVPVAKAAAGELYSFDIDPVMIATAESNVQKSSVPNVRFILRDTLEHGTGLDDASCGMVLLFNILHFTERKKMIDEATRILKPGGKLAIIHWRKDIATPRGPAFDTRPDREAILACTADLPLKVHRDSTILEPYHWGIQFVKVNTRR